MPMCPNFHGRFDDDTLRYADMPTDGFVMIGIPRSTKAWMQVSRRGLCLPAPDELTSGTFWDLEDTGMSPRSPADLYLDGCNNERLSRFEDDSRLVLPYSIDEKGFVERSGCASISHAFGSSECNVSPSLWPKHHSLTSCCDYQMEPRRIGIHV
jgi:hypothetical protein